ncbi:MULTISPECIES: lantibiotic dehydratase [unclassified Streptomyces]|uniref:lantibiotic dehydratase n=1 Tax=unclassified Streptomyces TaxID=2593676 RepID=UPI003803A84C
MTPGTDTRTARTTWEPGRRFMLRVAGLPVESVRALRCADSRRWADEVLEAEERLRGRGAALGDLLHALVRTTDTDPDGEGAAHRRHLLALRRQIFNNRLPADPEGALRLVGALDPGAVEPTADWLRERRLLEKLRSEGAPLLAAELARTRAALRGLLAEDRLRHGLQLASPTLEGQLDGYLAQSGTGAVPDRRMRKIERSVLSYVYRTACKTSPFSTFTAVAAGTFDDGATAGATAGASGHDAADHHGEGPGDPAAVLLGERWTSHVRLNVVVLARFAELVLADPDRRGDLPVRLASGWERDGDRVRYVRQWITTGDDAAAVTFDAVKDRLFFLRRSGTLDQLLGLFDGDTEPRYRDLVDRLRTEHDADPAHCETYVAALLQLGMVRVPCLDTDVHSPDPLRSFRNALTALGRPWADGLAAALEAPLRAIDRFPAADRAGRGELLRELRAGLRAAQRGLSGGEAATLPQTLLYEDVSAGRDLTCGLDAWAGPDGPDGPDGGLAGGALRSVERILPAFDLTLPQRVTFKGFFLARYGSGGRCDDLLGLVHDFHEDFFDQYLSFAAKRRPFDDRGAYVPEENWLGLPGIRALDAARRMFVDRMRQAWDQGGDEAAEIRLGERDLTLVADELAPIAGDFVPQCHHLQLARTERDGAPLIVLNRSYGGLSFPFSRFTHVYDTPDGTGRPGAFSAGLRDTASAVTPDGAVLAEITGGAVTSNLNLHSPLTGHQIVCPGESSSVPVERRIHLDDLYVEHDTATDRLVLRSTRLGREVIPVYLGYLVPLALPEIPRTLLLMSPTSMAPLDVWGGVPEGAARDGVTSRPRVTHGQVVLSRRSWATTAGALPVRRPGLGTASGPGSGSGSGSAAGSGSGSGSGSGDQDRFLDWQRWRRAHALPDRVFATVSGGPRGGAGAKPQYVDFDSMLSLTAFEALPNHPDDRIVLREMLPSEDGLHVRSARGHHVAELAVETFTTTASTSTTATATVTAPSHPASTPDRPTTKGTPTCQS